MCSVIRVVLIDDHQMVRDGLRAMLEGEPDIEIVGEADDGRQGTALVAETQPDVVVMDISMKEMNGLEATRRIRNENPNTQVIELSMYSSQEYVYQAIRADAAGFVVKDDAGQELLSAIREAYDGHFYLSPTICRQDIDAYIQRALEGELSALEQLTPREREVFQLIAEGLTTREIGNRLGISPKTVETHRSHLGNKLGIHATADLTRYAIRRGVVDLDR